MCSVSPHHIFRSSENHNHGCLSGVWPLRSTAPASGDQYSFNTLVLEFGQSCVRVCPELARQREQGAWKGSEEDDEDEDRENEQPVIAAATFLYKLCRWSQVKTDIPHGLTAGLTFDLWSESCLETSPIEFYPPPCTHPWLHQTLLTPSTIPQVLSPPMGPSTTADLLHFTFHSNLGTLA